MNKAANINFKISIIINSANKSDEVLFDDEIFYHFKSDNTDKICIKNSSIEIIGHRDSTLAFKGFTEAENLNNFYKSTIYTQILRSLIFYCYKTSECPKIASITFVINNDEKNKIVKSKDEINFLGKFVGKSTLLDFSKLNAKRIFERGDAGKCFFDSSLYLLQALTEENEFFRFERLWRSFNNIFNYAGQTHTDSDGLKNIKEFIKNNDRSFALSLNFLTSIDTKLLYSLRWKECILYQIHQGKYFFDSIREYSYPTIVEIFKSREDWLEQIKNQYKKYATKNNNKDILKAVNSLEQLPAYFSKLTEDNSKGKKNEDYLTLIMRWYIYFVRCSYFHGNKNDRKYSLFKDPLLSELQFINEYLQLLIVDCLSNKQIMK